MLIIFSLLLSTVKFSQILYHQVSTISRILSDTVEVSQLYNLKKYKKDVLSPLSPPNNFLIVISFCKKNSDCENVRERERGRERKEKSKLLVPQFIIHPREKDGKRDIKSEREKKMGREK